MARPTYEADRMVVMLRDLKSGVVTPLGNPSIGKSVARLDHPSNKQHTGANRPPCPLQTFRLAAKVARSWLMMRGKLQDYLCQPIQVFTGKYD